MNFDFGTQMAHMKFITPFSADEFTLWISEALDNPMAEYF
jgi:hypothetical protein